MFYLASSYKIIGKLGRIHTETNAEYFQYVPDEEVILIEIMSVASAPMRGSAVSGSGSLLAKNSKEKE